MTTTTEHSPFEDITRTLRERLGAQFEQNAALAREQFDTASTRLADGIGTWSAHAKADADALAASSGTVAKGFQDIGQEAGAYARTLFELSHAAGKRVLTATTPGEVLEAQLTAARSVYDAFAAESAKLRDLTLKTTEDATTPLAARFKAWSDTFAKTP